MAAEIIDLAGFRALDTEGTYASYPDAAVEAALLVANEVAYQVAGHDFADDPAAARTFDGSAWEELDLRRPWSTPLRALTSVSIDGVAVPVTSAYMALHPNQGPPYIRIRRHSGTWGRKAGSIVVTGDWGWASVPSEVEQALFRVTVLVLTGEHIDAYGGGASSVSGQGQTVTSVSLPGGPSFGFGGGSSSGGEAASMGSRTTGDAIADKILRRYRYERKARVV